MKKTSLSSTIIGSKNKIHQKEEANMSILSKILVTLVAIEFLYHVHRNSKN